MKAKILSQALVLYAVLMVAGPLFVYAQQTDEKTTLSKMLDDKDAVVSKWERMATILVVLTISIGVLGAATSALQKSERPWSRRTTIAVGLAVSALTVVVNTISDTDYRTLHRRSVEARKILADLRLMVYQGAPADQASHQTWLEQFQKGLHQISDLEEGSIKSASQMQLLKSVYAQSSGYRPDWVSAPPADQSSLFFLGTGVDTNLQQAESISHDNVLSQAVGYFENQFRKRLQGKAGAPKSLDLAQFVAKSAEETGTYFEYDRNTKTYRYYTLWKIRKERAEIDLQLFGLKQGGTLPQDLSNVVQQSPGLRELYLSQPFAYLVGEYELEESRISAIGFPSWRTLGLLGEVQPSGRTDVFIFNNSNYPSLKEGDKAEYSRLKQQVRRADILLDAKIADQESSPITVDGNQYLLEFRLERSKPRTNHARVVIRSRIGWQVGEWQAPKGRVDYRSTYASGVGDLFGPRPRKGGAAFR